MSWKATNQIPGVSRTGHEHDSGKVGGCTHMYNVHPCVSVRRNDDWVRTRPTTCPTPSELIELLHSRRTSIHRRSQRPGDICCAIAFNELLLVLRSRIVCSSGSFERRRAIGVCGDGSGASSCGGTLTSSPTVLMAKQLLCDTCMKGMQARRITSRCVEYVDA